MRAIKLTDIVDSMEMQTEEMSHYLNKNTGEIISITEEEIDAAENGEFTKDTPKWQEEGIKEARKILETDDYVPLPSQFDIHEYEIMERYCVSIKDQKIRDEIYDAIKGSGAFRRFKDKIQQYGIEESWHQYKNAAYREIAKEWCKENQIQFTEH